MAGRAASGKTAALSTAAETLNTLQSQGPKVEIHRVFPGAFDNVSSLIGRFLEGGAWADGVCVSLIRRGLAVSGQLHCYNTHTHTHSHSHLTDLHVINVGVFRWRPERNVATSSHRTALRIKCEDVRGCGGWECGDVVTFSQVLCLPSGERVVGRASCGLRLVLETGNLHAATPASLGTCVSLQRERERDREREREKVEWFIQPGSDIFRLGCVVMETTRRSVAPFSPW